MFKNFILKPRFSTLETIIIVILAGIQFKTNYNWIVFLYLGFAPIFGYFQHKNGYEI